MIGKINLASVLLLCFGIATNAPAQQCKSNSGNPPSIPAVRFIENGDGTVTDSKTGLMWAKCAEGLSGSGCAIGGGAASYSWQDALTLAEGKSLAGHNDWRLPDIEELRSIVEEQCKKPAIDLAVFPNTPSSEFWSASRVSDISNFAWAVVFFNGDACNYDSYYLMHVRLVRSGK